MTERAILLALFLLLVVLAPLWMMWLSEPSLDLFAADDDARTRDVVPAEFNQAGVCARCHVVSVLEWGISGHVNVETNCQACHGPSQGHVADERNQVKPDRLPRGVAIAGQLCSTCHEEGCPETQQVQSCQKCHHVHALINPKKPPMATDDRTTKLLARWDQFQQRMTAGEKHVKKQEWSAARAEFREALKLIPGNHGAQQRARMCVRRLNPQLSGFQVVGRQFDAETGLPRKVRVSGLNATMLLVPPGQFDMGSDRLADSRPVHTVRVDAFFLGQHEVTQAQWKQVMGTNPSGHQGEEYPDAERMPVERVSWDDCQKFLRRMNAQVPGGGFRLPTEAEWEYACGAVEREFRPLLIDREADEDFADHAWYRLNSRRSATTDKTFLKIDAFSPRPVGTRQPNSWGFYDMQGNVGEWCSSLFQPYLYRLDDGRESLIGDGMRVLRGGGYADAATALERSLRHAERPHRRIRWNGLRLARDVAE